MVCIFLREPFQAHPEDVRFLQPKKPTCMCTNQLHNHCLCSVVVNTENFQIYLVERIVQIIASKVSGVSCITS